MDLKIKDFIIEHHVLTLNTCINNIPYCSHCFYVFDKDNNQLIFTSDIETRHAIEMTENKNVAVGIALETIMVGQIKGIQITGKTIILEKSGEKRASRLYVKRFPFAILKNTKMWAIDIEFIKFTDNRLGFGKKIIWIKE
jgi:uncharacterized protein